MRKSILLLAIFSLASFAFVKGQVPNTPEKIQNPQEVPYEDYKNGNEIKNFSKKDEHGEGWYNYTSALSEANQELTNVALPFLHPDTLSVITGEGERSRVVFHSVGESADPKSEFYQAVDLASYSKFTNFTWDSVRFPYIYERPIDSFTDVETDEVQDTLYRFTVNGEVRDTLSYKVDSTYNKELTYKFFVNGMAWDSVQYVTDTSYYVDTSGNSIDTIGQLSSWVINYTDGSPDKEVWPAYDLDTTGGQVDTLSLTADSTEFNEKMVYDSSAMDSLFVEFYSDDTSGMPQVDSSLTVWRNYNVLYDTAKNQYDTMHLMADTGLKNSMTPYSYLDTISSEEKEVVDTLIIQYFATDQDGGLRGPIWTTQGGDTLRFMTVDIDRSVHRGGGEDGAGPLREEKIELTAEDVPEEGEGPIEALGNIDHRLFSKEAGYEFQSDGADEFIVGATVTFEPGYPYHPTDTLVDFSGEDPDYKRNAFRVVRTEFDISAPDPTGNNGFVYASYSNLPQKFNPEELNQFERSYYNPFIQSPENENSTPHHYMDFHFTPDNLSTEDVAGNADKVQSVYPNPATTNEPVTVKFETGQREDVSMKLFNAIGKEVTNVPAQTLNKGTHNLELSTNGLEPGVYFLNVNVGGDQETIKLSITQ